MLHFRILFFTGNKAMRLDSTSDTTARKHIFTEVSLTPIMCMSSMHEEFNEMQMIYN